MKNAWQVIKMFGLLFLVVLGPIIIIELVNPSKSGPTVTQTLKEQTERHIICTLGNVVILDKYNNDGFTLERTDEGWSVSTPDKKASIEISGSSIECVIIAREGM